MSGDKIGHLSVFHTSVTCRNTFCFSLQLLPWSKVEQSGGCFSLIYNQSFSSHSFRSVSKYKTVALIKMCMSSRQWKRNREWRCPPSIFNFSVCYRSEMHWVYVCKKSCKEMKGRCIYPHISILMLKDEEI